MKKVVCIYLTLVLLSVQAYGQLKDIIKKNEKAIFAIYTYDDLGIATGMGTGFFISDDGVGLTNYHVLEGASSGVVKTVEGKAFEIEQIISSSEIADIVKFKVNTKGEPTPLLTIKNSKIEKGEKVFVIGNPHGFESSVSEGIISSVRKIDDIGTLLQTTAPISPGSSGSPLMTLDGKVIGIATYQFSEGQNLNFAVSINSMDLLQTSSIPIGNTSPNMLIINERCRSNSELILNSIELNNQETVLNFSFTNVSMAYGPSMQIWTSLKNEEDMFFIQDLTTLEKYYAINSTLGTSRENGTSVALGETKRFKVTFPQLPKNITRVNIMEGLTSSWNFLDIDLTKYTNLDYQDTENHSKNIALVKLENQEFEEAKSLLNEIVASNQADHDSYNLIGIISYILDNNYDALLYFSKAIEISPNNPIYYFNRFRVYFEQKKDYDNALKDINAAIKILPNQGDHYQYRAYIYMSLEEWEKAVSDWDMAINLMGDDPYLYEVRGNCKTWLNDFAGACTDWSKAYKLSGYLNIELNNKIKEYCK